MIVDSWNKDMNHRGKLTCQEQLRAGVRGKKVDEDQAHKCQWDHVLGVFRKREKGEAVLHLYIPLIVQN